MATETILITGPPCSGKTTWCQPPPSGHGQPGDLVLDRDVMGPTAYARALEELPNWPGRALVIACLPGVERRTAAAAQLSARIVHLNPPTHLLMQRARQRPQSARHVAAIQAWLDQERGLVRAGAGDPTPEVTAWW
jgi:hypothetical protein